jgi:hypothetical protein
MNIPKINTHLSTTNIYVKRNIIKNNVNSLTNYIKTLEYRRLNWYERQAICINLTSQRRLLNEFDRKISELEQLSFPFGNNL